MVKKLISILVSTRLTAFLFISFSAAMAAGTFIESMHGTDASKILVYNAFWFEIIIVGSWIFSFVFIFNVISCPTVAKVVSEKLDLYETYSMLGNVWSISIMSELIEASVIFPGLSEILALKEIFEWFEKWKYKIYNQW